MTEFIPVENSPGLYRDSDSGAIVNKNTSAYNSYMSRKRTMDAKAEDFENMKDDLDNMKTDIDDIKSLVVSLNQKLNS